MGLLHYKSTNYSSISIKWSKYCIHVCEVFKNPKLELLLVAIVMHGSVPIDSSPLHRAGAEMSVHRRRTAPPYSPNGLQETIMEERSWIHI